MKIVLSLVKYALAVLVAGTLWFIVLSGLGTLSRLVYEIVRYGWDFGGRI